RETPEVARARRAADAALHSASRERETPEVATARRTANAQSMGASRSRAAPGERSKAERRRNARRYYFLAACTQELLRGDDPEFRVIFALQRYGPMIECLLCSAMKFPRMQEGLCCSRGRAAEVVPRVPHQAQDLVDRLALLRPSKAEIHRGAAAPPRPQEMTPQQKELLRDAKTLHALGFLLNNSAAFAFAGVRDTEIADMMGVAEVPKGLCVRTVRGYPSIWVGPADVRHNEQRAWRRTGGGGAAAWDPYPHPPLQSPRCLQV
ncbi:MAG: hypothetical protein VX000_15340, partial [Myxococcota bacterium]|nr:hypothetical protein [Myxococcota bacterium]